MIALLTTDSPVGPLTIAERGTRVCLLNFGDDVARAERALEAWYPGEPRARRASVEAQARLEQYFAGKIDELDRIEVELNGTSFQREVWEALRRIPAGRTISYLELARRIGRPKAVRAVGAANGANPVALIVPCHRVIGANGGLTGYGGGLPRKRWLLGHEGAAPSSLF